MKEHILECKPILDIKYYNKKFNEKNTSINNLNHFIDYFYEDDYIKIIFCPYDFYKLSFNVYIYYIDNIYFKKDKPNYNTFIYPDKIKINDKILIITKEFNAISLKLSLMYKKILVKNKLLYNNSDRLRGWKIK